MPNIGGAKDNFFFPSCYSELPRLAIHRSKEGIKKKLFYHLLGFVAEGERKEVRKKLIKKMNSIWLMRKIRVSM